VYERAVAGGAEVAREMEEADYGSRGFTVRDPEGNLFSFGTYRGE
ncbi:MAG: glyoxalase, partial [Actinomycetota bacterium]|nr:glyoxalase [Actinomycetota bacterium]